MDEILLMILAMGLVTYTPRALPMAVLHDIALPPLLQRFLENIPYAALGALIFPSILSVGSDTALGIIGGLTAGILAYMELNLVVVVAGAIGSLYLYQLFF